MRLLAAVGSSRLSSGYSFAYIDFEKSVGWHLEELIARACLMSDGKRDEPLLLSDVLAMESLC